MNANQLKLDLEQFYGTENYWRLNPFTDMCATDGTKYFCEKAQAFWLFDEIALTVPKIKNEHFIVVKIKADTKENNYGTAIINYEDGNYNQITSKYIEYTDLPHGEWKFYVIDNVVMLPSEY